MNENGLKPSVLLLLDQAHQEVSDFLNALPEKDQTRVERPDRWAPKDLLIHLLGWNVRMNRRMAGLPEGESPDEAEELNRINASIFEANRGRSWEDLVAEDKQAFADLLRTVKSVSEEDLTVPGRLAWAGTRPAWMALLGNGHWHPYYHISMHLVEGGQIDRATAIQERTMQDLVALGQGDQHKGTTLYNLACFYALTRRPREAIGYLRESLALAPNLVEWSKQDNDLDSLREDEDFKALSA